MKYLESGESEEHVTYVSNMHGELNKIIRSLCCWRLFIQAKRLCKYLKTSNKPQIVNVMLLNLYSILVVGFVPIFCWHDFHILLRQQLSISWLQGQLFVVVVVVKNPHIVVVQDPLCVFWSISQLSFAKLPMLDCPMVVTPVKNGHTQNRTRWNKFPFDLFVLWEP